MGIKRLTGSTPFLPVTLAMIDHISKKKYVV